MYREFIGHGNKVGRRIQYVFREDGGRFMKDEDFWVLTTKQDFGSGVDLSANWEDHPAFGDYAALLIKNRSLALV